MRPINIILVLYIAFMAFQCCHAATVDGSMSVPKTSRAINVTSPEQLKSELSQGGPMVVLYYATWCGACTQFKPSFQNMSNSLSRIRFLMVDVDKAMIKEHAKKFNSIPTMYVGKDEKSLREKPCEIGKTSRSSASLKLEILNCVGGK